MSLWGEVLSGVPWWQPLVWAVLAGPALLAMGMTLLNLVSWPRGKAGGRLGERLSVCVPARDEEATIEACVRGVAANDRGPDEILVFDDGSTDRTPEILAALQREISTLKVIRGAGELPAGWVGKPHACHQLAGQATGDVLLFVDADVTMAPSGIGRIASLLERADVVTAVPGQEMRTGAEKLVMPLLHLTYTSWLWLPLIWLVQDPRLLAANGQLLAVRREIYDAVGGFEAVRREVVDDMAFCRLIKQRGGRVVFADGSKMARCRMYGSWAELRDGFSKNLYEGLGARPAALLAVALLYGAAFVLPFALLPVGLVLGACWWPAALVGVLANVLQRGALAWRLGHPWWGVGAQPVAVMALLVIALNSFRWHRRGQIRWAGREYARRADR